MKVFLLLIYFFQSFPIEILINNDLLTSETGKKKYNNIESALEQNLDESYLSLELRNAVTLVKDIKIFQKFLFILYFIQLIQI